MAMERDSGGFPDRLELDPECRWDIVGLGAVYGTEPPVAFNLIVFDIISGAFGKNNELDNVHVNVSDSRVVSQHHLDEIAGVKVVVDMFIDTPSDLSVGGGVIAHAGWDAHCGTNVEDGTQEERRVALQRYARNRFRRYLAMVNPYPGQDPMSVVVDPKEARFDAITVTRIEDGAYADVTWSGGGPIRCKRLEKLFSPAYLLNLAELVLSSQRLAELVLRDQRK